MTVCCQCPSILHILKRSPGIKGLCLSLKWAASKQGPPSHRDRTLQGSLEQEELRRDRWSFLAVSLPFSVLECNRFTQSGCSQRAGMTCQNTLKSNYNSINVLTAAPAQGKANIHLASTNPDQGNFLPLTAHRCFCFTRAMINGTDWRICKHLNTQSGQWGTRTTWSICTETQGSGCLQKWIPKKAA